MTVTDCSSLAMIIRILFVLVSSRHQDPDFFFLKSHDVRAIDRPAVQLKPTTTQFVPNLKPVEAPKKETQPSLSIGWDVRGRHADILVRAMEPSPKHSPFTNIEMVSSCHMR